MYNKTIPLYDEIYKYVSTLRHVKDVTICVHPYPGTRPTDTYHYMMSHKPSIGYPSFWYGIVDEAITYRIWIYNNAGALM